MDDPSPTICPTRVLDFGAIYQTHYIISSQDTNHVTDLRSIRRLLILSNYLGKSVVKTIIIKSADDK